MSTENKKSSPPVLVSKCPHATQPPSPSVNASLEFATNSNTNSDDYGQMIAVIVGSEPNEQSFYAHKGLLEHYSSYFRAALRDVWEEGHTKTVKLPDDDPNVYAAAFRWIYSGKLYTTLTASGDIPLDFPLICDIYVFGDARGIPELCNAAIDLWYQKSVQVWKYPYEHLIYVYESTLPGSQLRRFVVNDATGNYNFNKLEEFFDEFPKEFLADVIMACKKYHCEPGARKASTRDWQIFCKEELCLYHDHSSQQENTVTCW
jgi:hypothetical protein